jgi:hypothetical protein
MHIFTKFTKLVELKNERKSPEKSPINEMHIWITRLDRVNESI